VRPIDGERGPIETDLGAVIALLSARLLDDEAMCARLETELVRRPLAGVMRLMTDLTEMLLIAVAEADGIEAVVLLQDLAPALTSDARRLDQTTP
jgi:hypothetical protein